MAGVKGLEPSTYRVTGDRSNQLSYTPQYFWWAVKDSNLWPSRCKRDALPTELTARLKITHQRQGSTLSIHNRQFFIITNNTSTKQSKFSVKCVERESRESMLCVSQSAQRLYCSNVKCPPAREGSFWIWKKTMEELLKAKRLGTSRHKSGSS